MQSYIELAKKQKYVLIYVQYEKICLALQQK